MIQGHPQAIRCRPVPSGAVPVPSPGAHAAVRHPPGSAPRGPGLLPSRLWGRHGARLRALGFNGEGDHGMLWNVRMEYV